jgi:drug/metabolite transporter (DMT)-like permease
VPVSNHPREHRTRAWVLVAAGVVGISVSGPLAAAAAAPALAVAFWRTALAVGVTGPVAALTGTAARDGRPARPRATRVRHAMVSGVMLAAHFGLWIPSLRLTSVAASTALVVTTPIWTVAWDRLRGVPVPRTVTIGVALAMAGMIVLTGVDAGRSSQALLGDVLALAGGLANAGYVLTGERVRRDTSAAVYATVAYGTCAGVLLPVCLVAGADLAGYPPRAWAEIAALTVAAQLVGHGSFAVALPTVGATPLAMAILLEVPGATLVAWAWLGQVPPLAAVPGALLVLVGLVVVARSGVAGVTAAPADALPGGGYRPQGRRGRSRR